ncbi:hypothetical protein, partial [Legionella sp. 29fVS95]|uniref:hypothetical protein n=1 Tax=Legionella sp. 29fVS95 TaxID=3402813 RepID=UPI003AF62061
VGSRPNLLDYVVFINNPLLINEIFADEACICCSRFANSYAVPTYSSFGLTLSTVVSRKLIT